MFVFQQVTGQTESYSRFTIQQLKSVNLTVRSGWRLCRAIIITAHRINGKIATNI